MSEKKDIVENLLNTVQNLEKEFSKMKNEFENFKENHSFNEMTEKVLQEERFQNTVPDSKIDNSQGVELKDQSTQLEENFIENNNTGLEEGVEQVAEVLSNNLNEETESSEMKEDEVNTQEENSNLKEENLNLQEENSNFPEINEEVKEELKALQEELIEENSNHPESTDFVDNDSEEINSENNSEENLESNQGSKRKIKNTKKRRKYCSKNLQSRKKIKELYNDLRAGLEGSC